jgi:hypothetical protein
VEFSEVASLHKLRSLYYKQEVLAEEDECTYKRLIYAGKFLDCAQLKLMHLYGGIASFHELLPSAFPLKLEA